MNPSQAPKNRNWCLIFLENIDIFPSHTDTKVVLNFASISLKIKACTFVRHTVSSPALWGSQHLFWTAQLHPGFRFTFECSGSSAPTCRSNSADMLAFHFLSEKVAVSERPDSRRLLMVGPRPCLNRCAGTNNSHCWEVGQEAPAFE